MNNIKVKIEGKSPLMMHNGLGASPFDNRLIPDYLQKKTGFKTFKEAVGSLSKKRGKTDEDHEKLAEIGFHSSLYLNEKGQVIYPGFCFAKALHEQSKSKKLGTTVKRSVFVENDAVLDFPDKGKSPKQLYEKYANNEMVKVSTSKTNRCRPKFPKWSATFNISYDKTQIDKGQIMDILSLGEIYGSLERRPSFGRYTAKEVK